VTTFGLINGLNAWTSWLPPLAEVVRIHPELRWRIIGPFDPDTNPEHAALRPALVAPWIRLSGGVTLVQVWITS